MRRLALFVALGIVTSVLLPLVLGDQAGERARMRQWRDIPDDRRNAGLARADSHGLFGRFTYDEGGNVAGRFVSFHFAKNAGIVHYLTVKHGNESLKFFDAVTPTPYAPGDVPSVTGSVFRAPAPNLTIRVHNNPVAQSAWTAFANGTRLVFDLAVNVTVANATAKQVRLNVGSGHGHIVTNGNRSIEVASGTVTVTLDRGEHAYFAAHPGLGPGGRFLHLANTLLERGRLAGVYQIADGDGSGIVDDYDVDANVTVDAIRAGRLDLTVASTAKGPRVFVFVVDPQTIDGLTARLRVLVDSQVLPAAASAEAMANGSDARFHAYTGDRATLVLVRITSFSTHTVVIQDQGSTTTATDGTPGARTGTRTPGLELGVAGLAVAGAAWAGRRRRT